jgi:hypothetical protein
MNIFEHVPIRNREYGSESREHHEGDDDHAYDKKPIPKLIEH